MEVTVKLNNIRRSPNKIRPTLYLIRGKNAKKSLDILKFTNKGCASELYQLVKSGIAAATEREMKEEDLFVKVAKCDGAGMLKRHRFGSRGRIVRVVKRNSHLTVTLSDELNANIAQPEEEVIKASDKPIAQPEADAVKPSKKTAASKKVVKDDNIKPKANKE